MLRSAWRHTDILHSYNWGKGIKNIGCNWLLIQANRQTQKALYFLRFSLNSLGTGFAENMIFKIIFPEEFISFENRFKSYFKLSMIIYVLHTCSEIPKRPTGTPGVHLKALIWYDFSKVAWFSWELITACWLQTLPLSKRVTACSDLLVPSPRTSSFQHICIFWSPSFVIRISKAGSCFPTFHVYFCLSVFVLCSCHENTWKILVLF